MENTSAKGAVTKVVDRIPREGMDAQLKAVTPITAPVPALRSGKIVWLDRPATTYRRTRQ